MARTMRDTTEVYNNRKCPECGGKLSHKMDCSKRDWRPDR